MEKSNQKNNSIWACMGCAKSTKPTVRSWVWSVLVLAGFIAQVIMNVLAAESFGSFGGASNSELSKEQPTFITPDGLTFSVWSIIYLFQGLFSIYQIIPCFQNSHEGVSRARFWVVLLYLGNCLWLPVFSHRLYWLAFMLMLVMDLSLVMIYRKMSINYGAIDRNQGADMFLPSVLLEDEEQTSARLAESNKEPQAALLHPWPVKLLCFTGFSTNASWLSVATLVNLTVAIGTEGWRQAYTIVVPGNNTVTASTTTVYVNGSEQFVVMGVCLVATIAAVMAVRNCDVPYALVITWALSGVHRAQSSKPASGYPKEAMSQLISDWAMAMIVVVLIAAVIGLVKAVIESFYARKTERENHSESAPPSSMHYTDEATE